MSLRFTSSVLALCFSFFLLFSTVIAINITKILSDHSDFSSFNDILTKTQVAATINSRQSITVLAVDNANISPLSGQPVDTQKKILSMHVILDYYDEAKLKKLPNKTVLLTTLYQSSGLAKGQEGFLNATLMNGEVVLGSGVSGSSLNAKLVKAVVTQPYNVSVLQISSVIMPGRGGSNSSSNSTSAPPPSSSSNSSSSPPPASSPSDSPAPPTISPPAPAPGGSKAPAPSKGNAPGSAPKPGQAPAADGPAGDTPVSSPPVMGPAAEGPAAESPPPSRASSIGETGTRAAMAVMVVLYSALVAKII